MENPNYILFEDYLSKTLENKAVLAFENRLKTDEAFSKEFNIYKDLSSFLDNKFENEEKAIAFQNNLKSISNQHFKVEEVAQKTSPYKLWQYAIAASVVLFFGIFTFNQFSNPTYGDFNNHETLNLEVRGTSEELLSKTTQAFNNKEYAEASAYFSELLKTDSENKEFQLYKAIADLELDKFNDAEAVFITLKEGNSVYKDKAAWYLALSKLKQKDNEACIEVLKTITKDSDNYKEAQKLLNKLD